MNSRKNRLKIIVCILVTLLCTFLIFIPLLFQYHKEVNLNTFYELMETGKIKKAFFKGNLVSFITNEHSRFSSIIPSDLDIIHQLRLSGTEIVLRKPWRIVAGFADSFNTNATLELLGKIIETILYISFWIYIINFRGSTSKTEKQYKKLYLKDIPGMGNVLTEVKELIEILNKQKDLSFFQKMKVKPPRGVLLYGKPGNGKTRIAQVIAGEANVEFIYASASEFMEVYVGTGPARVRELFDKARKSKNGAVIFIDEIDSIGGSRENRYHENGETLRTLNELLTQMDGMAKENYPILIILSTNMPHVLDQALTRSGRIDREIEISNPYFEERKEIIEYYLKGVPTDALINTSAISSLTSGMSRADLATLINEAKYIAVRKKRTFVVENDISDAQDRLVMGIEKRHLLKEKKEVEKTAYHEAGHAVIGHILRKDAKLELYKLTIVPRGHALGMAYFTQPGEILTNSKNQIEALIMISLAGGIAEKHFFGEEGTNTGVGGDLDHVRKLAETYITGAMDGDYSNVGRSVYNLSEKELAKLSTKVANLINMLSEKTKHLIIEHKDSIEKVAKLVLKVETVTYRQMVRIIENSGMPLVKYQSYSMVSNI